MAGATCRSPQQAAGAGRRAPTALAAAGAANFGKPGMRGIVVTRARSTRSGAAEESKFLCVLDAVQRRGPFTDFKTTVVVVDVQNGVIE